MTKTNTEKQKDLYERRNIEGWKRVWIPPEFVQLVKELIKSRGKK